MVDKWRTWVSLAKDERCWVWVLCAQSSWIGAVSGDELGLSTGIGDAVDVWTDELMMMMP
jgi:hypothetical protein